MTLTVDRRERRRVESRRWWVEKKRGIENFLAFCPVGTSIYGNDLAQPPPSVVTRPATYTYTALGRPGTFRGCSEEYQTRSEGVLGEQGQAVELLNFASRATRSFMIERPRTRSLPRRSQCGNTPQPHHPCINLIRALSNTKGQETTQFSK